MEKNPARLQHLIDALAWQGILTRTEAISAINAQRQGDTRWGGSEAVVHYGGSQKVIGDAFRNRRIMKQARDGCFICQF